MKSNHLLYSEADDLVIVRIEGTGTWIESKAFLEFSKQKIEEDKKIAIDLSSCKLLDSTFLGTLAYLALKKGKIEIFKPPPEVKRAIKTLGLEKIIKEIEIPEEIGEKKEIKGRKLSKREQAEVILMAHKSLVKVDSENLPEFQDLIEMMEKEVEKR
ncbi:MAG TPA: anti-sigma factor antagonist [Candidatus Omnitrophica bacterium]|nr:anti-sigma factor antagonist [Candidatus Omnitrophota bacterium]